MQALPHLYRVQASGKAEGAVVLATDDGATVDCYPPTQFGGEPGNQSPESLLTAALAGCYQLTFRAIASASGFSWENLDCQVVGTLDKVNGRLAFAGFEISATLHIVEGGDQERALKLLEKAERGCLVSASLACPVRLNTQVLLV